VTKYDFQIALFLAFEVIPHCQDGTVLLQDRVAEAALSV
jgi:hypothetical protein